ncbi:TupA-like ATPgrasp [Ruminococcaceae bacterium YRB3002]|nr:TupA-like ATPgrasp [Ruminococcaceae bacterium YRB3002]
MSLKAKLFNIYKTPFGQYMFRLLPDSIYIKIQYRAIMGKKLNLRHPKGFNEKLQWLKLHDRKKEYEIYADKFAARDFVKNVIGDKYLVKLLGVWDNVNDINYDMLPEKFVIKGAHDSGSVVVCRDKGKLDRVDTNEKMRKTLKKNNYYYGRDWPYKHIKPRIIAEEYLDNGPLGLIDYKFYCFHGEPKFLYISQGLENHSTACITFYDLKGKRMPFQRADYPTHSIDPLLPENFDEMIQIAKKLACEVKAPFIRIDLYNINGRIVFSEITFRPCSGYMKFVPQEWDNKVGEMLTL